MDYTASPLPVKIDRFSSLRSDASLMSLPFDQLSLQQGEIFQSRIVSVFQNKSDLFLYVHIPTKGHSLVDITLNGKLHHVISLEEIGGLHKYVIKAIAKNGKYFVTQYGLQDALFIRSTLHVQEEHIFKFINNTFYYDSKRYHQVHLIGELFHDIIDLTSIGSHVKDLLGRMLFYDDIKNVETKKIKLAFVAFNLFDNALGHYFVPEDIVEMKVSYIEDRHIYFDKKLPLDKNDQGAFLDISKVGKHYIAEKTQTIDKQEVMVSGGKQSEWFPVLNFFRYKEYRYDTIYKLQNEVKDSRKGLAKFTYAMVIGPAKGYRHARERFVHRGLTGMTVSYDYEETTLTKIQVFEVTYQEKGKQYKIPVSSLIYESQRKARYVTLKNRFKVFAKQVGLVLMSPVRWSKRLAGWGWQLLKAIGRGLQWLIKHWKLALIILGVLLLTGGLLYLYLLLT